jgi:hypothetical protein
MERSRLTEEENKYISDLMENRGAILMAFAQVEWFLAKLIVEASAYEQYAALDLSFSQDAEKRAEKLQKILNVDGPFSPYAADLRSALDVIIKEVDFRTMAAHGMTIRPDDFRLSGKIYFRMYRMYKNGDLKLESLDLTMKEYTDRSSALTSAAREFVAVSRKMSEKLKFAHPLDPQP